MNNITSRYCKKTEATEIASVPKQIILFYASENGVLKFVNLKFTGSRLQLNL